MKKTKKLLAFVLAIIMVVSMMPMTSIIVSADTLTTNLRSLGSGFNLLGDQSLSILALADYPVFNEKYDFAITRRTGTETTFYSTYINDINSYMESLTGKLDASLDTKAGSKLLTFEVTAKLGLSQKTTSSGSNNVEYCLIEAQKVTTSNTLRIGTSTSEIAELWNDGAIDSKFYSDLKRISSDADISNFFNSYGTHIITKYDAGAYGYVSYAGENLSSTLSSETTKTANVSSKLGTVGDFAHINATLDASATASGESSETNKVINTAGNAYGSAKGLTINKDSTSSSVENFFGNVTDETSAIIVDENLKLLPIWELLVNEEDADIKIRLEQYFNEHVSEQMTSFYEDYIYSPISDIDYSDYEFITSASQLNDIRNNLNGKYVLLCDIDLSSYPEWSPIGTDSKPFIGVFDGNGNTISGLNITKMTQNAVGLFGNNDGLIRNVIVSGKINVNSSGFPNDVSYVGGIVGKNTGTIERCVNNVNVYGSTTITKTETAQTDDIKSWFDDNFSAITIAEALEATVIEDNGVYDTFPVKLTGNANNVTINIPAGEKTAFIVLENTNIGGCINSIGDNTRPVCIINAGSNSIAAPNDTVAINVRNANLYITGNGELTVSGGNGSTGANGKNGTSASSNGASGSDGSDGENGLSGKAGISCQELYCNQINLTITGGDGGNGGNGGKGGNGYGGYNGTAAWDTYVIAQKGGNGGNGGNGGDGGNGSVALSTVKITTYNNSEIALFGGDNGYAGSGGNGGNGGKGGNGGTADCGGVLIVDNSRWSGENGANGGNAGNGGNTGKNGYYALSVSNDTVTDVKSGRIFEIKGSNIVNTSLKAGTAGTKGSGGSAGRIDNYSWTGGPRKGTAGSAGSAGTDGTMQQSVVVNQNKPTASVITSSKCYNSYFSAGITWDDAQKSANDNNEKLVSICSEKEQTMVEDLMSYTLPVNYWIGLKRYSTASEWYNVFEWQDGTKIKVNEVSMKTIRINDKKENVCDVFTNWGEGEPNNLNIDEPYCCINSDGYWEDTSGTDLLMIGGYITESDLIVASTNTVDKNAIVIGGICGYNGKDGKVEFCYNEASVSAGKVDAEKGITVHAFDSGITAFAGGIAGYSAGKIDTSLNVAPIKAIALSDSMYCFADSYAVNIANGSGTITNSCGTAEVESIAISSNGLSDQHSDLTQKGVLGTDPSDVIDELWKNRPMHIEYVNAEILYLPETNFDRNSVTVTVDGTEVPERKMLTNYYFGKGGKASEVAISYGGYTRTILVKVDEIKPVSIEALHAKTDYTVGESFTADQLSFKIYYNDESTKIVKGNDSLISITAPNMNTVGMKTVTVKYADKVTLKYTINVTSNEVAYIEIQNLPTKTVYEVGENFDESGLALLVTYTNGQTETVTAGIVTAGFSSETSGEKKITVSYGGKTAFFNVTVNKSPLLSISIVALPSKVSYETGDSLNTNGLQLKLSYKNGTFETVESGFTTSGFDSITSGTKTVTVSYGGFTDTFTVTVKEKTIIDENAPQIVIGSKSAHAGDTVQFAISLKNSDTLKTVALSDILFDTDCFELVSGEWKIDGSILSNVDVAKKTAVIGFENNTDCNGELFILTFKVKEDAEDGTYPISCSITAKRKEATGEQPYSIASVAGNINITSTLKGDTNGDDEVNSDDAIYLLYYTLLPDLYPINQDGDFDGNGEVNSDDAIYLLYYTLLPDLYPLH